MYKKLESDLNRAHWYSETRLYLEMVEVAPDHYSIAPDPENRGVWMIELGEYTND